MTQSIKAIYDAILAAAKRDELIVVEPEANSSEAAMLCAVSMDSLDITPLTRSSCIQWELCRSIRFSI